MKLGHVHPSASESDFRNTAADEPSNTANDRIAENFILLFDDLLIIINLCSLNWLKYLEIRLKFG